VIASSRFDETQRRGIADAVLGRLPEDIFGNTDWARLAVQSCAAHLDPAIRTGQPYRIAAALRALAHAPTVRQVDAVAGAVCDALLAEAYAARNSRLVADVAGARSVADAVVAELRDAAQRAAADRHMLREQVAGYVRLVALHDAGIAERLDATGAFAARIAHAMKLEPQTVLDVELAGRLADIGMAGIPAATRAKRGIRTKRDHERVRRHAALGESFVRDIPALSRLAAIVRSHHERYDGRGYPDGLGGDEIPLESRIISVAATFVDLLSDGPQAKAVLASDAGNEIALRSGTEFDPAIVAVTLRLLQVPRRTHRTA
jgi:HD-GYP domain-containing protein (c-di-GMP phosphodiesterase class II)